MTMTIRTSGEPGRWADPLRSTVLAIDPDQAVYNVRPFEAIVARATAARRFQAFIVLVFAAAALVLAAAGVYSVVAYGVRQRRQEIGVRLALGARGLDVVVLAVGDSLRWAAWGLLCGGALAFVAARSLAGILYEIPPTDAAAFTGAAVATSFVIVIGSVVGARGALTVEPLVALRD
jgi:ABC-type antimicrobial peptide transport system permease subunit